MQRLHPIARFALGVALLAAALVLHGLQMDWTALWAAVLGGVVFAINVWLAPQDAQGPTMPSRR